MEMLYTVAEVRQAIVSVGDLPGICPDLNCGFAYEEDTTPGPPDSNPLWDINTLEGDLTLVIEGTDIPKWGPQSDCVEVHDNAIWNCGVPFEYHVELDERPCDTGNLLISNSDRLKCDLTYPPRAGCHVA